MKSPWVSRDAFEAVVRQLHDANALIRSMAAEHHLQLVNCHAMAEGHSVRVLENAQAEADRAEKRYADLMASYRMLKLQGAVEQAQPQRVEPAPVDPVDQAIREECRGKPPEVARQMREQVKIDRANSMDDEKIIANIRRGSRPAEEMAS